MRVPGIFLAVSMAIAGCSGATPVSPEPTSAAVNDGSGTSGAGNKTAVELRFDETVKVQDLELEWLELDDSRCPIGVVCVWEGQIVATFEASLGAEEPVEFELVLRAGMETKTARAFDYELRLQGVDPHPKEGVTPERGDYVAHLEVTEP